jgi:N-acetylglucosamine kinase-like BadF-type ATPase
MNQRANRLSSSRFSNVVAGVDAGATHTRAWLATERGDIIGKGEAGPGNPHVSTIEGARREIVLALQRACADGRVEYQMISAAFIGIAGVARLDEYEDWLTWARLRIAPRVQISHDGEMVIAAGCPDNWGIALIAGTGSSAWGKTADGRTARAGGWGWLFGDEGSSYDLARQALRAASQAADGRGAPTRLLDAILAFWDLPEPSALIARVYRSGMKNADVAALAMVVVHQANAGDAVASRLITEAANALVDMLSTVARALRLDAAPIPLALTGGLILNAALLRTEVLRTAYARGLNFQPVTLVHDPVRGAVRLALELARTSPKD